MPSWVRVGSSFPKGRTRASASAWSGAEPSDHDDVGPAASTRSAERALASAAPLARFAVRIWKPEPLTPRGAPATTGGIRSAHGAADSNAAAARSYRRLLTAPSDDLDAHRETVPREARPARR